MWGKKNETSWVPDPRVKEFVEAIVNYLYNLLVIANQLYPLKRNSSQQKLA